MAVTQRLEFRQSQSLVMTPQLQQAIKLLQLSNLELAAYVEQELERNPLLEPEAPEGDDDMRGDADDGGLEGDDSAWDSADYAGSDRLSGADEAPLDSQPEYDDNSPSDDWGLNGPAAGSAGGSFADEPGAGGGYDLESRLSQEVSLRDHLVEQLQMDIDAPLERLIGLDLIDALDDAGYLRADLAEVAARLGCELELVAAVLARLQRFDPPGIFARDLKECLALQLADRDHLDPYMQALLEHLDVLAQRDLARLRKLCGVDEEDLADMLAELRALDPKPAERFEGQVAEPVVADILMRAAPDGGWHLELNPETLPRVLVNHDYYVEIAGHCRDKASRGYLSEQLQAANWLVKALHQRATTILKVAGEIVRRQDAFFRKGVHFMRPLTLRDVAEAVSLHESTVSRVTANKYIATPRGLFELKYFFTTAIAGTAGSDHSSEAVRHRIRALIDAEVPDGVLSDDTIVTLLRGEGIDIARRTVAKYREGMHIPSSVQRRREKALGARR